MVILVQYWVCVSCLLIVGNFNDMWWYDLVQRSWLHLYGSMEINTQSNYSAPYPGGLNYNGITISGDMIYVFGGYGRDGSSVGSDWFICVNFKVT